MKRRSSLVLSVIGCAGLLALGAWYYWSGTIYHSLSQLSRAIKTYDRYLFEKHVDLENVTRRFIDDLLDVSAEELQGQATGTWEEIGTALGITFVQLIKPRLVDEVQHGVIRAIESGTLVRGQITLTNPSPSDQLGNAAAQIAGTIPEVRPLRLGKISASGIRATVELSMLPDKSDTPQTVRLRFIRTPERYWRTTEIENAKDLLVALKQLQEKRLEEANQPIRKRLDEAVFVVNVTKEQGLDESGMLKDAFLVVSFKNTSPHIIHALSAGVTISTRFGTKLHEAQVWDNEPIPPGETKETVWSLGLDLFDDVDRQVYETEASNLVFTVEMRQVIFADGASIKLANTLEEAAAYTKPTQAAGLPETASAQDPQEHLPSPVPSSVPEQPTPAKDGERKENANLPTL